MSVEIKYTEIHWNGKNNVGDFSYSHKLLITNH